MTALASRCHFRTLFAASLALVAIWFAGCNTDDTGGFEACDVDEDCGEGWVCVENQCVDDDDGTADMATPSDSGGDTGGGTVDMGSDLGETDDAGTDSGGSDGGDDTGQMDAGSDASSTDTGGTDTGADLGMTYTLDLTILGNGSGEVLVDFPGTSTSCTSGSMCTYSVPAGSNVTLDPQPDASSDACPWLSPQSCSGGNGDCNFVMNSDVTATIQFTSGSGGPMVCLQ